MAFKGFFIDDNQTELVYGDLLSTPEELSVFSIGIKEIAELSADIFREKPDIVAIDFRLDESLGTLDAGRGYKGSGLAQLLRDKTSADPKSDFPIILLSTEHKIKGYQTDNTAHDLFDRYYVKGELNSDSSRIRREALALCRGYDILRSGWDDRRADVLLGLTSENAQIVLSQEVTAAIFGASAPHGIARFILRDLIDRPGLLMSASDVAALLGVESAIEVAALKPHLPPSAKYQGLFGDGWPRWWRYHLEEWAEEIFATRPLRLTGAERVERLNRQFDIQVAPAKSRWNQSSDERFALACACCGQPSELRHSVRQFDPRAPRFAQPGRICWYCIYTDDYQKPQHGGKPLAVDQTDIALADRIKEMEYGSDSEEN